MIPPLLKSWSVLDGKAIGGTFSLRVKRLGNVRIRK